jgi:hypothetical protein
MCALSRIPKREKILRHVPPVCCIAARTISTVELDYFMGRWLKLDGADKDSNEDVQ